MAVLGINCATENLSLALTHPQIEKSWQGPTILAENLVLYLDELLKEAKLTVADLTKIGIAIGPGAFTGLRLSLIMAKTICLKQEIPLVPISTLEAMVQQAGHKGKNNRVILTACRGDVSTAFFDKNFKRLEPDHPIKAEAVPNEKDTILLKDIIPDARTIAIMAASQEVKYDKKEILKLLPQYSHEARVNLTNRPELQHLKIGKNHASV